MLFSDGPIVIEDPNDFPMIPVIAGSIGGVVLLAIIILTAALCMRSKTRYPTKKTVSIPNNMREQLNMFPGTLQKLAGSLRRKTNCGASLKRKYRV